MARHVLVVGDVMEDIIVVPEGPLVFGSDRRARIVTHPGGSAANQATWLAALGMSVRFAARVGEADREKLVSDFAARGVEARFAADPDLATGRLVTLIGEGGERSFLTDRGANLRLARDDLPTSLLEGAFAFLLSGYSLFEPGPRRAVLEMMAAARRKGVPIAVDPASIGFLGEVGPATFLDWVGSADLVLANEDEARLLTGLDDIEAQIARLGERFTRVVIKLGARGAVLGGREGLCAIAAAPPVVVSDTTGAGDAFAAGFLRAWYDGAGERPQLEAGIAAGTLAVQMVGGHPPAR